MISTDYIKSLASELASHNDIRTSTVVKDLLDLADQLDYLEERDTITDSRLALMHDVSNTWRDEVEMLQEKLIGEQADNLELRKQVRMLKRALLAT
jgi:hypothetical protein